MAEETAEVTLEQELQQYFEKQGTPEKELTPGKEKPAVTPASSEKKVEAATEEEDPLEKALKEIPDEEEKKEEKEEKPALSTEQQSILAAIPSAEVAATLFQTVENYNNFTAAFEGGKYDQVVSMFEKWDKGAFEGFLEHLYQKHVASDGTWVTRFIAEQEGRGEEHKGLSKLEKQIKNLESKLADKDRGNSEAERKAESQRVFDEYKSYVGKLFDTIQTPAKDRAYILRDLNDRVSADPKVMQEVRKGNKAAVHSLFKKAVREFNTRDKETTETEDGKLKEQGKKKTLLPAGTGLPTDTELPDDVRQVKKGEEDNWVRGKLNALFKQHGLGAKK